MSRQVVQESQRERLLEAMAEVQVEKGYHAVTIADVVRRAGTSRRVFYEHFDDKKECFLTSFSRLVDGLLDAITARFDPTLEQSARAAIVIGGFIDFFASRPVFAWTYFEGVDTIGAEGVKLSLAVRDEIATMLVDLRRLVRQTQPDTPPLTKLHALAVGGAIHEIINQALHDRGAERLVDLKGELVPLAVALLEAPVPQAAKGVRAPRARKPAAMPGSRAPRGASS